jgi:hypothetical protein
MKFLRRLQYEMEFEKNCLDDFDHRRIDENVTNFCNDVLVYI